MRNDLTYPPFTRQQLMAFMGGFTRIN